MLESRPRSEIDKIVCSLEVDRQLLEGRLLNEQRKAQESIAQMESLRAEQEYVIQTRTADCRALEHQLNVIRRTLDLESRRRTDAESKRCELIAQHQVDDVTLRGWQFLCKRMEHRTQAYMELLRSSTEVFGEIHRHMVAARNDLNAAIAENKILRERVNVGSSQQAITKRNDQYLLHIVSSEWENCARELLSQQWIAERYEIFAQSFEIGFQMEKFRLEDELSALQIRHANAEFELECLNRRYADATARANTLEDIHATHLEVLEKLKEEDSRLHIENALLKDDTDQWTAEAETNREKAELFVTELQKVHDEHTRELAIQHQQSESQLLSQIAEHEAHITELEEQLAAQKDVAAHHAEGEQSCMNRIAELEQVVVAQEQDCIKTVAQMKQQVARLRMDLDLAHGRTSSVDRDSAALRLRNSGLKAEVAELEALTERHDESIASLNSSVKSLTTERDKLQASCSELQKNNTELLDAKKAALDEAEKCRKQLAQIEREHDDLNRQEIAAQMASAELLSELHAMQVESLKMQERHCRSDILHEAALYVVQRSVARAIVDSAKQ